MSTKNPEIHQIHPEWIEKHQEKRNLEKQEYLKNIESKLDNTNIKILDTTKIHDPENKKDVDLLYISIENIDFPIPIYFDGNIDNLRNRIKVFNIKINSLSQHILTEQAEQQAKNKESVIENALDSISWIIGFNDLRLDHGWEYRKAFITYKWRELMTWDEVLELVSDSKPNIENQIREKIDMTRKWYQSYAPKLTELVMNFINKYIESKKIHK